MRVVVVGATGNVGTSLLDRLVDDDNVDSILGLARRRPRLELPKVTWAGADIAHDDLVSHFRGADAVVHLAWAIQPSHDLGTLRRVNVDGSARVFRAVAEASVPTLVYASSVGAYSPGPKDRKVDESWPTGGIATSFYSRHKAEVERLLDRFEAEQPGRRVVRLRPALIFKREAGAAVRRLFVGPLFPRWIADRGRIPVIPRIPDLRFQAVHSYDVGRAYHLAVTRDARGAFNIAADPVLDPEELARILDARAVAVPRGVARAAAGLTWRLHLQPTPEGWVDMALQVPLLDPARAERELGWTPEHDAAEALRDILGGVRDSAGLDTPVLAPDAGGPGRVRELMSGIGSRTGSSRTDA
jgi:nucleoside-diphosphate-sugar epimerase